MEYMQGTYFDQGGYRLLGEKPSSQVESNWGKMLPLAYHYYYYYYYYYYDSIYLWMPYKKQAKPGAASVTQGPWTGKKKKKKKQNN